MVVVSNVQSQPGVVLRIFRDFDERKFDDGQFDEKYDLTKIFKS